MIPGWMAAARVVLLATLLAGCTVDGGSAPPAEVEGASSEARLIGTLVREARLRHTCGPVPSSPLKHAFVLTARECFSCMDVAPALREFMRADTTAAASLGIVTTESDTLQVCEYLRREKVRLPVFTTPDFSRSAGASPLIRYVAFDSKGNVSREEHALIPAELLDKIRR